MLCQFWKLFSSDSSGTRIDDHSMNSFASSSFWMSASPKTLHSLPKMRPRNYSLAAGSSQAHSRSVTQWCSSNMMPPSSSRKDKENSWLLGHRSSLSLRSAPSSCLPSSCLPLRVPLPHASLPHACLHVCICVDAQSMYKAWTVRQEINRRLPNLVRVQAHMRA